MHFQFLRLFLAFFLLRLLKAEAVAGVQQEAAILEETTTIPNGEEIDLVGIEIEEEISTTTSLPEGCSQDCTEQPIETCECNCLDASLKELCDQLNIVEEIIGTTTLAQDIEITTESSADTTINSETNNEAEEAETTTASSGNDIEEITTQEPIQLPSFNCSGIGLFANPTDCHQYYNCIQADAAGTLAALEELCPTGLAFNTEFMSCMRDLSPCSIENGGFECSQAGSFPDPNNDTNVYYRCVPHLDGTVGAYHKYIVKCGTGKIYMPQLGKCFVDLNTFNTYPVFAFNPLEVSDEQLIKMELKQWKTKEKAKLKAQKQKLKYEEKLQKELAKKQAKEAKEKAKAEKKQQKELGIVGVSDEDEI